jgi:hypothetical protein
MYASKPGVCQTLEVSYPFLVDILGGSIHRYALPGGKHVSGMKANRCQILSRRGDSVARREKKCSDPGTIKLAGLQQVSSYVFYRAYFKARPAFIYHAKAAAVVRFAWWSVNWAFKAHGFTQLMFG